MIGMIVSHFPEMHETFIAREFRSLREAGIPICIYSLKKSHDTFVHPDAETLLDVTVYVAWNDPRTWFDAFLNFARHPIRGLRGLLWVLTHHSWPPVELAKSLVVWVQAMALSKRMKQDGVHHVHSHWATMPTTAACLCSKWNGLPFSFTAHAWDIFVRNRSLAEKVALSRTTITCTEYNRRYLSELCPDSKHKILLNYHGVDLGKFKARQSTEPAAGFENAGTKHTSPIILSVGRLADTKGFEVLIDACQIMRERGIDFQGIIVGSGPLRRPLQERIGSYQLNELVEMRSAIPQDELRQLYRSASVFVVPSVITPSGDRDGIPNVLFEAMAMKIPVVSTSVSGIPEAVIDKKTGLLVPPQDAESLAAAIEQFIHDPQWASGIADQARDWIESRFSSDFHMQQLVAHMRRIANLDDSNKASVHS